MKKFAGIIIIVLIVSLVSGCPKKAEYEFEPSKVTGNALYYQLDSAGKASGGMSQFVVTAEKKDNKKLMVAFSEGEVLGSGDMWRAAGWSAALTSSLLLGVDLTKYEIQYSYEGRLDGPSAGGLMTVATLASFLGEKIKKDVAMTGTVDIDGSIGPVGGIIHKLEGAKDGGAKLVLVPAGKRFDKDMNTDERLDLVEKGKSLGITVKFVGNIFEAYKLLVGKSLPKPSVSSDFEPKLSETTISQIKAVTTDWDNNNNKIYKEYKSLTAATKKYYDEYINRQNTIYLNGKKHFNEGLFASAYGEIAGSALQINSLYAMAKTEDIAYSLTAGGMVSARQHTTSLGTASSSLSSLYTRLENEKSNSVGESLAIANAFGKVLEGHGLSSEADKYVAKSKEGTLLEELSDLRVASWYYTEATLNVEFGEDYLKVGMNAKGAPAPSKKKLATVSELLRKAADSNIKVFEKTVLAPGAESANMSEAAYQAYFQEKQLPYLFAKNILEYASQIKEKEGKSTISSDYVTLGAALNSYTYSSYLNSVYYSLDAVFDKDGNITSVNEKAMMELLDYNLKRAKENIAVAEKSGGISPLPIFGFETAKVKREGTLLEKIEALEYLRRASLEAQVMTMLSGRLILTEDDDRLQYKWKDDENDD